MQYASLRCARSVRLGAIGLQPPQRSRDARPGVSSLTSVIAWSCYPNAQHTHISCRAKIGVGATRTYSRSVNGRAASVNAMFIAPGTPHTARMHGAHESRPTRETAIPHEGASTPVRVRGGATSADDTVGRVGRLEELNGRHRRVVAPAEAVAQHAPVGKPMGKDVCRLSTQRRPRPASCALCVCPARQHPKRASDRTRGHHRQPQPSLPPPARRRPPF